MKTVQMTLDDDLVREVDLIAKELKTTRSALTRRALRAAIQDIKLQKLEKGHRIGYERQPVVKGEFDVWHDEQVWGDQ
jgi:metal-responsive CopG/Arc/MetJ family transcriptional regulator